MDNLALSTSNNVVLYCLIFDYFNLEKELGYRRPTLWDLLPFVIYRGLVSLIKSIPSQIKGAVNTYKEEKKRKLEEEEEQKEAEQAGG